MVLSTLPKPNATLALRAFEAPVPPFAIATIPFTLLALPVNVPLNVPALMLFAVIVPAAKLLLSSLDTIVFGNANDVLFNAPETPGIEETTL